MTFVELRNKSFYFNKNIIMIGAPNFVLDIMHQKNKFEEW